jgi:hypothetical protein
LVIAPASLGAKTALLRRELYRQVKGPEVTHADRCTLVFDTDGKSLYVEREVAHLDAKVGGTVAAWLGWTLDAFDFTIFLLIMVPIAETFHVPLIEVTAVFTVTLWLRLVGAVGSGWLADRIGRKAPLMISILWYSAG